jgi:hypothetical protein
MWKKWHFRSTFRSTNRGFKRENKKTKNAKELVNKGFKKNKGAKKGPLMCSMWQWQEV